MITLKPGQLIMDNGWPDITVIVKHNQPIKGKGPYVQYLAIVIHVLELSNDQENIYRPNSIHNKIRESKT